MAFCANCGSEVAGRFCAKCGSPVAPAPGAGVPPIPPQPPQQQASQQSSAGAQSSSSQQQGYTAAPQSYLPPPSQAQAPGMTDNVAAALCYVLGLVTGILFLVLAPYNQNKNIRFHAFQSIFLHVGSIAVFIALMVCTGILRLIPFLGVLISAILYPIVAFGFFILWLVLMYKAYNNERWVLPVIGDLAEKQA
ncbi:MAG: hypothetical protein ABL967_05800 [Bryobacteraceae bacterium]